MNHDEVKDARGGRFWMDDAVIDRRGSELGPFGIAVYMILARRAGKNDASHPSVGKLASQVGMSKRQAQESLKSLVKLGLVKVERRTAENGRQTSNRYTVLRLPEQLGEGAGDAPYAGQTPGGEGSEVRPLKDNPESKEVITPPVSPPRGKSFKAEDSVDYAVKFEQFVEDDELGPLVARLVKLAGAENKSRRMRYSRAWNEFVLGLQMLREEGFTDQALRFALSEAIKRQAPNMNYVKKTAKSYVPDQPQQTAIQPTNHDGLTREQRQQRMREQMDEVFGEAS